MTSPRFLGALRSILLIAYFGVGALSVTNPILDADSSNFRELKAAARLSDLAKRDQDTWTTNVAELVYTDSENHRIDDTVFFSRVHVSSPKPFLVLEDIEQHLESVHCTESSIKLSFSKRSSFDKAIAACSDLHGSHVITSHGGCNHQDSRVPFLIEDVSSSEESMTLVLSTKEKKWSEAFGNYRISYGHSREAHHFRRHNLSKRSDIATATTDGLRNATVPTGTPKPTSGTLDLSFEETDSTFGSFPLGLGPSVPISVGCKHCKTTGSMTLTEGEFQFDTNIIDNLGNLVGNVFSDKDVKPLDVLTRGYVSLEMDNFTALVDLAVTPSLSGGFTYKLFDVPLFGFSIPKLGKAGLLFEPQLNFDWAVKGGIELSYGFDLQVPDKSRITIDLANPSNSSVTGFPNTTIQAVPFQANISDAEISISVTLKPRVTLAFSFLDDHFLADAGAFLDLPQVDVTVTQLATSAVGPDCEKSNGTSLFRGDFENAFQNLTHIQANVGIGAALDVNLNLDIPAIKDPHFNKVVSLASTGFALPTFCLAFQTDASSGAAFIPAATAMSTVVEKAKASISSASAAASASAKAKIDLDAAAAAAASPTGKPNGASGRFYNPMGHLKTGRGGFGEIGPSILVFFAALFTLY